MRIFLTIVLMFLPVLAQASVVKVEKSKDSWQLLVDGKPYFVKGLCYQPAKIGESASEHTMRDWAVVDDNKDGLNDFAYQTWVDANTNNVRDPDEKLTGDFRLLKDMGVNTIRIYHHPSDDPELVALNSKQPLVTNAPNKKLYRELYEKYGIRIMMGDLIGAYAVATGADWSAGTDYTDPKQKANMLKSVERMIKDFKDEPYILMWGLGNENNLLPSVTQTNARAYPEAFAKFVNEVAQLIHKLDPNHPVCLVNAETQLIDSYAKYAPDVDIIGINSYRNLNGFNTLWKEVAAQYDKPLLITEFGTGYPPVSKDGVMNEDRQLKVHEGQWQDILDHAAGGKKYPQTAIGGFVFEWLDNWWQSGNSTKHDLAPNGWHYEFCGITSHGDGKDSPFQRQLRKVYFMYQKYWQKSGS